MRVLGIETSCDETAAAVVEVKNGRFSVLSNVVASQINIHAKTGGVVPEVAARAHVERIVPVVEDALRCAAKSQGHRAKSKKLYTLHSTLYASSIDVIAVTAGPGLMTSLLVGVEVARTLAYIWKKPVVAVNHLAGHVYANWLPSITRHSEGAARRLKNPVLKSTGSFARLRMTNISFPALCLIVSGGHTELVLMRKHMDFKIIGSTRDDAAGEAFDKVAKMLNLGYPGGPEIARLAGKSEIRNPKSETNPKLKISNPKTTSYVLGPKYSIRFPRPMINSPDFDFSFSGLKTAVLYYIKNVQAIKNGPGKNDAAASNLTALMLRSICYEFQEAVTDVLVSKTVRAAKQYKVKTVLLGGGVAANTRLREQLGRAIQKELPVTRYALPVTQYATDNAAMIAAAGYFRACKKQFTPWHKLDVDPNWELGKKFQPIPR